MYEVKFDYLGKFMLKISDFLITVFFTGIYLLECSFFCRLPVTGYSFLICHKNINLVCAYSCICFKEHKCLFGQLVLINDEGY
jgi:hypothetical protein